MAQSRVQGRHAGITRDQVLRAAIRLADRDGAGSLSMRKLAGELDVEAMTLYHHVRNKQALEDAIVEYVIAESFVPPVASASWQEVIAGHADDLSRALTRHPGAVNLVASRPAITPRILAVLENLLGVLHEAGFAPRTALHLVHAVAGAVVGAHLAAAAGEPQPVDPAAGVIDEELPLVSAALADGPVTVESRLRFTVAALIAGFATFLEDRSRGAATT